jgi:hypothetical protein
VSQRQEDPELEASLCYSSEFQGSLGCRARPCLKINKELKQNKRPNGSVAVPGNLQKAVCLDHPVNCRASRAIAIEVLKRALYQTEVKWRKE